MELERDCIDRGLEAPIVQGATSSPVVLLSDAEQRAIVAINLGAAALDLCSGVIIAHDWVLTARHCADGLDPGDFTVVLGSSVATPDSQILVEELFPHHERDLMLVRLTVGATGRAGVEPIPVAMSSSMLGEGDVIEIAGFGRGETNEVGLRTFAAETVTSLETNAIVVSGDGLSGACEGDSGGPLLYRDDSGRAVVLGVLSTGDGTCIGRDRYERLDSVRDWVNEHATYSVMSPGANCDHIGVSGRCFGDTAIWCQASNLEVSRCVLPSLCGWNGTAHGYRCVAQDPCAGVTELGACQGTSAARCLEGKVIETHCSDHCDSRCARSPRTGRVGCLRSGN